MTASWKAFRDKELEKFVEIEEKALQELKWSEMSLPLSKFVKDYTMPQIVQIVDGYYSEEEDSSLSSGQILKIHCLKTVSKVFGCDQNGDDIHVPLNTPQKILTRPENYNHIYETVNDLVNAKPTPKFVEIIRGYYDPTGKGASNGEDLTIEAGERLEVIQTTDHTILHRISKDKQLILKNMKGVEITLPLDCSAGFKPLLMKDPCFLAEATNINKLPFYASFVETRSSFGRKNGTKLSKYGVIKFKEVYKEDIIVASCGHLSVRVIFTIPKNIDVTIKVALGALTNDPEYAELCQDYNNYRRIDDLAIKRHELDIYKKSGEIKGYEYHMKTALEGEFIGMTTDNEQNDDEVDENDVNEGYVYCDRGEFDKSTKTTTLPYEITYLKFGESNDDENDSEHHCSSNEKSGSYNFQTEMATDETSKESVKLVKMKSLSSSTENINGTENDVKITGNIIEAKDADGYLIASEVKRQVKKNSSTFMMQITSDDKRKELVNISTTPKRFPPKPKPRLISPKPVPMPPLTVKSNDVTGKTKISETANVPGSSEFQIPKDLSTLDAKGVVTCLNLLNLNHLAKVFKENQINGSLLVSLDDEDYRDFNLKSFERKKLLRFAKGWRPDGY